MTLPRWIVAAVGLLLASPIGAACAADEPTGSAFNDDEAAAWVRLHNAARREVGVPELQWSPELAKYAQAWADELARTGHFEHRPAEGEWQLKYGESIAIGFNESGVEPAFRRFLAEKDDYEPGTPLDEESFPKVGHYTAIVWRQTRHVGAGKAVVATGKYAGATITVTNYDPPGNTLGAAPY